MEPLEYHGMSGKRRRKNFAEVLIMNCNNSCWWIILLVLFLCCGCGNGFGTSLANNGGCGCGCDNNCGCC